MSEEITRFELAKVGLVLGVRCFPRTHDHLATLLVVENSRLGHVEPLEVAGETLEVLRLVGRDRVTDEHRKPEWRQESKSFMRFSLISFLSRSLLRTLRRTSSSKQPQNLFGNR